MGFLLVVCGRCFIEPGHGVHVGFDGGPVDALYRSDDVIEGSFVFLHVRNHAISRVFGIGGDDDGGPSELSVDDLSGSELGGVLGDEELIE